MNLDRIDRRLGMVFAILSAVLFGTMPLFTKTAYAYGCNAYTVAFGRFLVGALGSGLIIILLPNIDFRVTRSEFQKLAGLSIFYAATPVCSMKPTGASAQALRPRSTSPILSSS